MFNIRGLFIYYIFSLKCVLIKSNKSNLSLYFIISFLCTEIKAGNRYHYYQNKISACFFLFTFFGFLFRSANAANSIDIKMSSYK